MPDCDPRGMRTTTTDREAETGRLAGDHPFGSTTLICFGSSTRMRTWSASQITLPVTRIILSR
jgi:hypothetical protein